MSTALATPSSSLRFPPPTAPTALALGDARVDGCLPGGRGLPLGRAHEIAADGVAAQTGALAAAFAAIWLARLPGARPIVWIASRCDLYPPGLLAYGLNPARLLLVRSADDTEALAAMEVALRGGAAAAVVAEVGRLPPLAGRRLHLACLAQGCTGFVLRRWPHGVRAGESARDLAAVATRWRIAPAASRPPPPLPGMGREPGPPRWRVALTQARGGRADAWLMELALDATDGTENRDAPPAVRVVAGLADPASAADAPGAVRRRA